MMTEDRLGFATESWEKYWEREHKLTTTEVVNLPELQKFWKSCFTEIAAVRPDPNFCLELASGTGSVSKHFAQSTGFRPKSKLAFDASIAALKQAPSDLIGVVGNLANLPFRPFSIDLLTSQFGAEYGGVEAILESFDLVAPGGHLAFVLHSQGSVVFKECRTNRLLLERFLKSRYLDDAQSLLAVIRNGGGINETSKIKAEFQTSLRSVETFLGSAPTSQALETILQVYNAVADMVESPFAFHREDIEIWFKLAKETLHAYLDRMSQMETASLSNHEYARITKYLWETGFNVMRHGILYDSRSLGIKASLGHIIVAKRTKL